MAIASTMIPLGTPAPRFELPSIDGRTVAFEDLAEAPALLVMFLCNHCPYVRHVEQALGRVVAELEAAGLAAVGIASNDVDAYPDDGPAGLAGQATRAGFTFPYLLDSSQQVAKAYRAACTPDFFLYGRDRTLAYRGEFDSSRPSAGGAATGAGLRAAAELVLAGRSVPEPHAPGLGCGIKWKPGKQPA